MAETDITLVLTEEQGLDLWKMLQEHTETADGPVSRELVRAQEATGGDPGIKTQMCCWQIGKEPPDDMDLEVYVDGKRVPAAWSVVDSAEDWRDRSARESGGPSRTH